ncbi:EamA family transporter [Pedobacter sp. HMF7647]|uniref:EamA family transporter n=1 Tax=Hufsiella arboris TaxID=2695275 RepID=A0A7K1YD62_9SPHI|nr:DMT family transporter [Hufsiella arboris]MXV52523.1 EamA family transporter [Hufsiella arboris]
MSLHPSHSIKRNLLILHATVFVWGFTGILGALISVSAVILVWYRVLIAFVALWAYFKATKTNFKLDRNTLFKLLLTGGIVGLHWILFFEAIKVSTVSVALVCLSSLTLFTAILEPVFNRQKISPLEIFTGILIVAGICLIFKFESKYTLGIICGLSCALCASLFSIINSKFIKKHPATVISFYELGGAFIWISLFSLFTTDLKTAFFLHGPDLFYLVILGVLCTSVAYVAGVSVMRDLSAFRVALVTNLEPVYGILLAFIFFGKREQMTGGFYLGAVIILTAVFMYPYLKTKVEKRRLSKQLPMG